MICFSNDCYLFSIRNRQPSQHPFQIQQKNIIPIKFSQTNIISNTYDRQGTFETHRPQIRRIYRHAQVQNEVTVYPGGPDAKYLRNNSFKIICLHLIILFAEIFLYQILYSFYCINNFNLPFLFKRIFFKIIIISVSFDCCFIIR